jgi:uncharacterized protein YdeI (BOF family)
MGDEMERVHNGSMKTIVLALLSLTLLAPVGAFARPYHLTSVRWIVATRNNIDVDDRYVTIVGHVTRRISDEKYWFTDATGQVRLESENFDLPIGKRIVLGGRIDQAYLGFGHIEVDVRAWHYAPVRRFVAVARGPVGHPAPVTRVSNPAPAPEPVTASTPVDSAPASVSTTPATGTATTSTTTTATSTNLAPPAETK